MFSSGSRSTLSSNASLLALQSKDFINGQENLLDQLATDPLIEKAVQNGTLKIASQKRLQGICHQFHQDDTITSQHIIGDSISMPRTDWEFTFNLYIPWTRAKSYSSGYCDHYSSFQRRRKSRKSHRRSQSATFIRKELEKVYVYTTFRANYAQIERIDNTIIKRMCMGFKYFAMNDEKYPSINKSKKYESISKKRGEKLIKQMKKEEEFIIKPKLPPKRTGWFGGNKSATYQDLELLANYLHHLLASPSLGKASFIFEELKFPEDLVKLLRNLANNNLEAWRAKANQRCIRDPSKLNRWGDDYEFHTVYIVRRPLNDTKLSLFNFNHWALKFEGMYIIFLSVSFEYILFCARMISDWCLHVAFFCVNTIEIRVETIDDDRIFCV